MEENQTKICTNCKRDIPTDNYLIHSVHCAKNIRVCPACKEPVPVTELNEHHEKMHKLLPCKKCGEGVCGADLEDHIRDSCALTAAVCRHCQLVLPRKEMPAHESYCGTRTEQCPDCKEYVMIKYRQIHLDSNHGFLKLDDEPTPIHRSQLKSPLNNPILRAALNGTISNTPPTFRPNVNTQKTESGPKNLDVIKSTTTPFGFNEPRSNFNSILNIDQPGPSDLSIRPSSSFTQNRPNLGERLNRPESSDHSSENSEEDLYSKLFKSSSSNGGAISRSIGINNNIESRKSNVSKRTNDQPQINTSVEASNKVDKNLVGQHRGAIKKRQAPRPPSSPPQDPSPRDLAYWRATARFQEEERLREEQSAINIARGLPPVLNPAAKLEKLRKMDDMLNRETEDKFQSKAKSMKMKSDSNDFSNLKPMSNEEFMNRFEKLQLKNENKEKERLNEATNSSENRFNEIKRDLTELRRGLNEVTAPYNTSSANGFNLLFKNQPRPSRPLSEVFQGLEVIEPSDGPDDDMDVELPCEFCDTPVAASQLVLHQTGCRPDLARYAPCSPSRGSPRSPPRTPPRSPPRSSPLSPPRSARTRVAPPDPEDDPVIPCEFCALSLPVYMVAAHQMNCVMLRNDDDSIEMLD